MDAHQSNSGDSPSEERSIARLEHLAEEYGSMWTASEVVAAAHSFVRGLPYASAAERLRAKLSQQAVAAIQQSAQELVEEDSDAESFCIGYTSTYAPATFDESNRVSMDFVRHLAANLNQSPSA